MSSRTKYTQQYKREAVQLAKCGDVPIGQVARDLGINANLLGRVTKERDVVREAAGFFARSSK